MKKLANWGGLKKKILNNKKSTAFYSVMAVLAAAPIVFMLALIFKYSVNVPWWDQVGFVDLIAKLHNGTLSFYDLWVQHNEHRILVPQAVELVTGSMTGWNFRVYVFLNWLVAVGSYTFIILLLRRLFVNKKAAAVLAVVFAWLMFSPMQWNNWLFGFQLAFFMSVLAIITVIWMLTRKDALSSNKIFGLTLVLAVITTYCNGNGLLVWPIGLGLLLWRRAKKSQLLLWVGVGIVTIASYMYHFKRSPESLPISDVAKEPVAILKYTLIYLGRNLGTSPDVSKYVGIGLLTVFIISLLFLWHRGQLSKVMSWAALASYALATAFLAAISRLNFGVNHAFIATSYTTISVLFIVATLAIAAYALNIWVDIRRRVNKTLFVGVLLLAITLFLLPIPGFVSNFGTGLNNFKGLGQRLKDVQHCVYTASSPNDECVLLVYPDKQYAWQRIQFLRSYGWADFKK